MDRQTDPRMVRKAQELAADVLAGRIDPLLGCIQVLRLRPFLPEVADERWDLFAGTASELDGFPVGEERKYWDPKALIEKDKLINVFRERNKSAIIEAFSELSSLLGP